MSPRPAVVESEVAEQARTISHAVRANELALTAARAVVSRSRVVRLAGIGSSRHAAGFGAACLEAAGVTAVVHPAAGAGVPLPRLADDHCLVLVSQSGETPGLLPLAESARRSGAAVVAVTNARGSTLESLADVTLHCDAGAERVVAATKSVTAQMALLRALTEPVDDDALLALETAVAAVIAALPSVGALPVPEHVVSGGFAAEWVADEIAIKLAETAGRLVSAESLVDHLHGPAAVHVPTLALLDPADPNSSLVSGAHLTRVGPSPLFDIAIPSTGHPDLDAILWVVTGQCLVLGWARQLGEDPDAPRGLSKVTRTF